MDSTSYSIKKIYLSDDIEIAYLDEGQGSETLVFVHGLGSYMWAWKKNIDGLRQSYRCIALDLVGYGQSSDGDFRYSIAFFAETVKAFIEKLQLTSVTLVGHSMGGQIATTMVLSGFERIKKLILVAPAGIETFNTFEKELIKNMYSPFLIQAQKADNVWLNYDMCFYKLPDEARFMIVDRVNLMKNVRKHDIYCKMIARCVAAMLDENVYDKLYLITQPTLIVIGANDALVPNRLFNPMSTPLSIGQRAQQKIPNSELVVLSNCGHFVQFESSDRFNELVHWHVALKK